MSPQIGDQNSAQTDTEVDRPRIKKNMTQRDRHRKKTERCRSALKENGTSSGVLHYFRLHCFLIATSPPMSPLAACSIRVVGGSCTVLSRHVASVGVRVIACGVVGHEPELDDPVSSGCIFRKVVKCWSWAHSPSPSGDPVPFGPAPLSFVIKCLQVRGFFCPFSFGLTFPTTSLGHLLRLWC